MKALTLWEPWATLIALGVKRYETRSWGTKYRGPLAIHAAKRRPEKGFRMEFSRPAKSDSHIARPIMDSVCVDAEHIWAPAITWSDGSTTAALEESVLLTFGAVVCTCELTGCRQMSAGDVAHAKATGEFEVGGWEVGRWAWKIEKVKRLAPPVSAKGSQGFWEWNR